MRREASHPSPRFWQWGYAASFLATLALGFCLGQFVDVRGENPRSWDRIVEHGIQGVRPTHPGVTEAARLVTRLGNIEVTATLLTVIVLILILLRRRGWSHIDAEEAPFWLLVALGGQMMNWALKLWFQRPRPEVRGQLVEVGFYSFPSGHGTFAGVSLTLVVLVMIRVWRQHSWTRIALGIILIGTLSVAVAGSRVWLGVHYLSDVLAGFVLGVFWAASCHVVRFGWPSWRLTDNGGSH